MAHGRATWSSASRSAHTSLSRRQTPVAQYTGRLTASRPPVGKIDNLVQYRHDSVSAPMSTGAKHQSGPPFTDQNRYLLRTHSSWRGPARAADLDQKVDA
jgi:hypothetical protein